MNGNLLVTMGAPGSGKSTYAKQQYRHVVTTDALRGLPRGTRGERAARHLIFQEAFATLRHWLLLGQEIALDTTANNPSIRRQAVEIARECYARATLLIFDPSVDDCINAQRDRQHPVADEQVREVHASIRAQIPGTASEGWDEVVFVRREVCA